MRPVIVAAGVWVVVIGASPALAKGTLRATASTDVSTPGDPWEASNRKGFAIEMALDRAVFGPVAKANRFLMPGFIGKAVHNFVVNLGEPLVVANDLLQIRPGRALKAATRFFINSTIGLAGAIDIGAKGGIPHRNSSFGDTLGRYGVKSGPYLFLPLVGPSSVRDLFGNIVDGFMNPVYVVNYPVRAPASVTMAVLGGLDQRVVNDDDLKALMSQAADPYATLRSTYLQHRQGEVEGERPIPAAMPDLPDPEAAPSGAPRESAPPKPAPTQGPTAPTSVDPAGQSDGVATPEGKTPPLQPLPDKQGGNANGDVPGALDER